MHMTNRDLQILVQKNPKLGLLYPDLFGSSKKAKYRNTKVYVYEDGVVSFGEKCSNHGKMIDIFDSIKEYERFHELRLLEKAKQISQLERQVKMVIQPAGTYQGETVREISYKADFRYTRNGICVVEDVKPFDKRKGHHRLTKDFSLKWKMLKMVYPYISFEIY